MQQPVRAMTEVELVMGEEETVDVELVKIATIFKGLHDLWAKQPSTTRAAFALFVTRPSLMA